MRGSRARFVRAEARRLEVGYRWLKRRWVRTPHAQREPMLASAGEDWFLDCWSSQYPHEPGEPRGLWAKMRAVYERMKLKLYYDR